MLSNIHLSFATTVVYSCSCTTYYTYIKVQEYIFITGYKLVVYLGPGAYLLVCLLILLVHKHYYNWRKTVLTVMNSQCCHNISTRHGAELLCGCGISTKNDNTKLNNHGIVAVEDGCITGYLLFQYKGSCNHTTKIL